MAIYSTEREVVTAGNKVLLQVDVNYSSNQLTYFHGRQSRATNDMVGKPY